MPEYENEMSYDEALAMALGQQIEPVNVDDPSQRAPEPGQEAVHAEPSDPVVKNAPEPSGKPAEPAPAVKTPAPSVHPEVQKQLDAMKATIDQFEVVEEEAPPVRENQTPQNTVNFDEELTVEEKFAADPVSTIMELATKAGVKPSSLAQDLWYEGQGDRAPNEYRAVKEARAAKLVSARTQSATQKAQKAREEQQRLHAAQANYNQYVGKLEAFSRDANPEEYKLIAAFAEKLPQKTLGWMYTTAETVARRKGSPPSAEEVATELEKELRELAPIFVEQISKPADSAAATANVEEEPPAELPNTLRANVETVQPDRKPVDPYSDEALRQNARAAMAQAGHPLPDDY